MKPALTYFTIALLAAGCIKDELPIPAADRGDAVSHRLCMGTTYSQQLWFDLGSGSVVSQNARTDWDLAFESAPDGWHVMLNGARLMTAWNIGPMDLTAGHDTVGMSAGRRIDAPSGDLDSTAIGDWRNSDDVYIIDLGYDALGASAGQRKLRILGVASTAFTIESAMLDGSGFVNATITKDLSRGFTCFSFANGTVPIEPLGTDWDLLFTQYTHLFYEPFLPYLVNGVLVDGRRTRVARISGHDFASITLADTLAFPFEQRRNTIGYDWKTYSFETSTYTIVSDLAYIVQDGEGWYYKLRFLDFYGDQGQTGCPMFETVRL
ncbi:MAG: HmuY family protein [Flavobacteriales bacterium]|nr:HmuY family protein [Flavobacteriales bacterium]